MSKIFVNPSAIRAGLADLEMAEETVDLINRNIEDNQAHLQGEPIEVDNLPEDMRQFHLDDEKLSNLGEMVRVGEGKYREDFQMNEGEDPNLLFQSYLDNVGVQIVRQMRSGERFLKIWSQTVEEIISYVSVNFPNPPGRSSEDKSTQTTGRELKKETTSILSQRESQPSKAGMVAQVASGPPSLEWSATNGEDDLSVEAEIAHQIAESFSKKYKFPSRSSGIFLYNFEQLEMNLDDIVKEAKNVPGVTRLAHDGSKIPLRCVLGWVALANSKKFQLLVEADKLSKIMQDDLDRYTSC
uniref:Phosphoprotein n=6 Tax=Rabies virus TaxID=11292 RepID=PHOSP_RABVH|nr:RecName: Full=Phosphoprotein; Short=Protein P; AltName: Full=Protein M1 [Rabies virus HEP-FLURY]ADK90868.1 phosphoprotein [Lyssavirus rabies]BAN84678.1 phosphoprotein [Rabies viral vector pHEP5.0-delG-mRFP]BAN84683.1 phosphoprotein [Rabies viral vector pHEP5.0-CVSG-mRFP]ADK90869.1 phosphoprotein [Lyssavirus rabies]ADK90870.1 phosphoprotein [Lyssavirus rabies]